MCIIVYKPNNVELPSEATMKKCWDSNSDGAGIMYPNVNKRLTLKKGFMKWKDFWEFYKERMTKETTFVAHFRIKTHGKADPDNTHPFWVKKNEIGIVHNGVLPIARHLETNTPFSDTNTFVAEVLSKWPDKWWESDFHNHVLEEYMGSNNKMVLMDNEGKVQIYNKRAGTEEGGCWYSNSGFRVYTQTAYVHSRYNGDDDFGTGAYRRHDSFGVDTRSHRVPSGSVTTSSGPQSTGVADIVSRAASGAGGSVSSQAGQVPSRVGGALDPSHATNHQLHKDHVAGSRGDKVLEGIVDAEKDEPNILEICRAIDRELGPRMRRIPAPRTAAERDSERAEKAAVTTKLWDLQRAQLLSQNEARQLQAEINNGNLSLPVMRIILSDMRDGLTPQSILLETQGFVVQDDDPVDTELGKELGKEETVKVELPTLDERIAIATGQVSTAATPVEQEAAKKELDALLALKVETYSVLVENAKKKEEAAIDHALTTLRAGVLAAVGGNGK